MIPIELVRRVVEPHGDRADRAAVCERVRAVEAQQRVAVGRRLDRRHAILLAPRRSPVRQSAAHCAGSEGRRGTSTAECAAAAVSSSFSAPRTKSRPSSADSCDVSWKSECASMPCSRASAPTNSTKASSSSSASSPSSPSCSAWPDGLAAAEPRHELVAPLLELLVIHLAGGRCSRGCRCGSRSPRLMRAASAIAARGRRRAPARI